MGIITTNRRSAANFGRQGETVTTLIYWRGRIHILLRRGGSNLQDDQSVYIPLVISSANTIGAVRKERNMLTPLPLVVQKMPIQKALTSGNGNIKFYRESTRSNLKIIPDHKNAIQVYSLFADPPPFFVTIYL